jgi:ribosome-associated toxin RatA of RatAB toxin-antitoxin module
MGKLEGSASAEIEAPIETVYAIAADVERSSRWQPEIKVAECVERDDEGHSALFHMETNAGVKDLQSEMRFSFEAPNRIAWTQEDGALKAIDGSWELEDLGDGRTRVTYWMEVDLGRKLSLVLRGPLLGALRGHLVESMPGKLKAFVEGEIG